MNKKVNIIVDSTADITEDVKERLTVVPLTLRFGDEEYIEGVTIQKKEFYQKLIESDSQDQPGIAGRSRGCV